MIAGMNTTNRKRDEWSRQEVARIDASLAALRTERIPSGNWRRIRAKAAAASRLHQRRARLVRVEDDGPTPF